MESQENNATPEILLQDYWMLHAKNKKLNEIQTTLQKRLNALMCQDTSDDSSILDVLQMDETVSREEYLTLEDFPCFDQAKRVLSQSNMDLCMKNTNLSGEIEGLQSQINDLIIQRTSVKETLTMSVWQDLEDTSKVLLQEKEVREVVNEKLQQEVSFITRETCEAEERERQALRDNQRLQREVQELRWLVQKKKRLMKARGCSSTMTVRAELEEVKEAQSLSVLLVQELKEEVNALHAKIRDLEEQLQGKVTFIFSEVQGSRSKHSLRQGFFDLFIPGCRTRYSSRETLMYRQPGEQAREETQRRRPTLWERLARRFWWNRMMM